MAQITLRRRGRERALQLLVALDFTKDEPLAAFEAFWAMNATRPGAQQYAEELVRGVHAHLSELDAEIAGALENWTPDRVGYIERAALRLALFEMLYQEDVPPRVATNEAIEVVKRFGSDDAPRFINGVLDRVMKSREL